MNEEVNVPILILAAGASKRMGEKIKQLLPWRNTTLLENAIGQARESYASEVYVVLGANAKIIKEQLALTNTSYIYNKNWSDGMGSSIVAGIDYLTTLNKAYDGVVVMLADQPLIDTAYLNEIMLKRKETTATIVSTAYGNGVGVPAYFDKRHFSELLKLNKDYGARNIINKSNIFVLDPKGKAIDIDTWAEYQNLMRSISDKK